MYQIILQMENKTATSMFFSADKHLVRAFKDRSMVPSTMSLSSSKSKTKQGQKKLRQWNCGYLLDISLPLSNFKTNTKVSQSFSLSGHHCYLDPGTVVN